MGKGHAVQTSYILEVYLPYSTEHIIETIQSPTPFLQIQRGDVINPASLASVAPLPAVPLLLKVVGVEHMIEHGESNVTHRVLVYTTEVPDNRRARLQQFRTKRPYAMVSIPTAG